MTGYDENFLTSTKLPLPNFSPGLVGAILKKDELRQDFVADYVNYSVIMNADRDKRSPVIVALNIDQKKFKKTKRVDNWRIDTRIGNENQLDDAYYMRNPWDRGHMARRATAAWGKDLRRAQRASNETFYYSNSCLQHANLNQDEWLGLEDWVYDLKLDTDGKISSFSGPFYGDYDRTIDPVGRSHALIPAGFFKVVCFINKKTKTLDTRAFAMYQDAEALKDKKGRNRYNNQTYQVTISEIEELTGLEFDDTVFRTNPLYYGDAAGDKTRAKVLDNLNIEHFPERHEVAAPKDLLHTGDKRPTIRDEEVDVFIAAAMIDPKGADRSKEWVSLINLGNNDIDVSNWTIKDNQATLKIDDKILSAKLRKLKPGESCVIRPITPLQLSNSGDIIKLFNDKGERVDWVNYTEKMVSEGKTLLFLSPRDTLDIPETLES